MARSRVYRACSVGVNPSGVESVPPFGTAPNCFRRRSLTARGAEAVRATLAR